MPDIIFRGDLSALPAAPFVGDRRRGEAGLSEMARPTKYEPERAGRIIEALKAGNTRRCAALANGITDDTLTNWMRRYSGFSEAVLSAEAQAEADMVKVVREAARDTYTAAAWYLERKNPRDWGRKDTLKFDRMKDDELLDFIAGGSGEDGPEAPDSRGDREAARAGADR